MVETYGTFNSDENPAQFQFNTLKIDKDCWFQFFAAPLSVVKAG